MASPKATSNKRSHRQPGDPCADGNQYYSEAIVFRATLHGDDGRPVMVFPYLRKRTIDGDYKLLPLTWDNYNRRRPWYTYADWPHWTLDPEPALAVSFPTRDQHGRLLPALDRGLDTSELAA